MDPTGSDELAQGCFLSENRIAQQSVGTGLGTGNRKLRLDESAGTIHVICRARWFVEVKRCEIDSRVPRWLGFVDRIVMGSACSRHVLLLLLLTPGRELMCSCLLI
jgi:hypothetical protein